MLALKSKKDFNDTALLHGHSHTWQKDHNAGLLELDIEGIDHQIASAEFKVMVLEPQELDPVESKFLYLIGYTAKLH